MAPVPCRACCPHGAICLQPRGHEGQHISEGTAGEVFCRWNDSESISREEADRLVATRGLLGQLIEELTAVAEEMADYGEDASGA